MTASMPAPLPARSARKRTDILSAGRELFLANGYQGTSVDQIALAAQVSKQTVYKHFGDKRELLLAIVTSAVDGVVESFTDRISGLAETSDLESDLLVLAREYLQTAISEPVVQLRRLVIGEANRLPELATLYYERAPARTLAALAATFARLDQRGVLEVPEPTLAAEHFAFLIVGRSIDQALFCGASQATAGADVDAYVRAGVSVFLAGYRPGRTLDRR